MWGQTNAAPATKHDVTPKTWLLLLSNGQLKWTQQKGNSVNLGSLQ